MPSSIVYKLRFRSPMRVGERGVGLEVTRPYVPADTLFSALCSTWRELYGSASLLTEILPRNTAPDVPTLLPPFFLTSAFPFAGAVYFFPKPLVRAQNLIVPEGQGKDFRSVRFVSEAIFAKFISAQLLQFDQAHCGNGREVWFDRVDEQDELREFWIAANDDYEFWRVNVRPRVTLDRVNSASQIWHIGSVHFKPNAGLWFAVDFADEQNVDFRQKFEACLRLLGDTGLGGERGGGYGLFDFDVISTKVLPTVEAASAFITLAPFCPGDEQELARLTSDRPAYEIITRRGWIGSREGSTYRRKTIWMLGEGSVFSGTGRPRPGTLVDLTPEIWRGPIVPESKKHRVYRYGYAFPVGFRQEVQS